MYEIIVFLYDCMCAEDTEAAKSRATLSASLEFGHVNLEARHRNVSQSVSFLTSLVLTVPECCTFVGDLSPGC